MERAPSDAGVPLVTPASVRRERRTAPIPVSLLGILLVGGVVAAGIVGAPWLTVALGVVLLSVCLVARWAGAFLVALGVALVGYAFLGRGFAYLGVAPVYVGEAVLGLGALTVLLHRSFTSASRSPLFIPVVAFSLWGAARTLPYVGEYGLDALRDAVVWGYTAFAFLVATLLVHCGWTTRVPALYARVLPFLLLWLPMNLLLNMLPTRPAFAAPGAEVPLLGTLTAGQASVHLATAAVFLGIGLHARAGRRTIQSHDLREWICWAAWAPAFILMASWTRGGMLAVLAAGITVLALKPSRRWGKPALLALLIGGGFFVLNVELRVSTYRSISPQQIVANFQSVWTEAPRANLEGTAEWRKHWWSDIIDYTGFGRYFWTGKGFGVNLADDDGYQVMDDRSLRSPHNGHLTILARMGVPGLVLWVILQVTFAAAMLRAFVAARRRRWEAWANVNLWVLATWAAVMVEAAFDVYFEGPQGAIFFWSLFGFGVAALELQRGRGQAGLETSTARSIMLVRS